MISKCHACGKPTHIDLLDAKPGTEKGWDPANPNWERFECWECYGDNYFAYPGLLKPDSYQMIQTMEARHVRGR